jgi:hypothetical protein
MHHQDTIVSSSPHASDHSESLCYNVTEESNSKPWQVFKQTCRAKRQSVPPATRNPSTLRWAVVLACRQVLSLSQSESLPRQPFSLGPQSQLEECVRWPSQYPPLPPPRSVPCLMLPAAPLRV